MPANTLHQRTLDRLKEILRRDLKLGPDLPIPDDMPLIGSQMDLDSLDMLLLVTHIEKEFGVKIPSQAMGNAAFQSVQTLATYVESAAPAPRAAPAAAPIDLLSHLPHRDPFRFVSSVTRIDPGVSGTGTWVLAGTEPFFAGHFPGNPIVPGVLISEALAQMSGLVTAGSGPRSGVLVHVDVRFERPVVPPAQIVLESHLTKTVGAVQMFDVVARCGDAVVCSGSLALHWTTPADHNGKP
jgi:3-hydroxyacyl-[acyl-carrier-protein] dehydratase